MYKKRKCHGKPLNEEEAALRQQAPPEKGYFYGAHFNEPSAWGVVWCRG